MHAAAEVGDVGQRQGLLLHAEPLCLLAGALHAIVMSEKGFGPYHLENAFS